MISINGIYWKSEATWTQYLDKDQASLRRIGKRSVANPLCWATFPTSLTEGLTLLLLDCLVKLMFMHPQTAIM